MSRSGYNEDCGSGWELIRWRGAVSSAIKGGRGQAFLKEMLEALDALPEKRLVANALVTPEGCCAMGAVALKRGTDTSNVEPYERDQVAELFGIAEALAAEVAYINDDSFSYRQEAPEQRFVRVRAWVVKQIRSDQ